MIEFILFALLGVFYWVYRRTKRDNDERFAALWKRVHQLDSEVKNGHEARWSDISARLGELKREVESLQSRPAGVEKHEPSPTAPPLLVRVAPLPARAESRVVAEPMAPKTVAAPPSVPLVPKPVPIPPTSAVPPLSSDAVARLSREHRQTEGPPVTAPPHGTPAPMPTPPVAKMASPGGIEPAT